MASTHPEVVANALALLETIEEPHPSGALLATFITEALKPAAAAHFLSTRLLAGNAQALVSTWTHIVKSVTSNGTATQQVDRDTRQHIFERDGGKCCITGRAASIWDPLVVVPVLPLPLGWITDEKLVNDMLGAFFGSNYRDWWLFYTAHPDSISPYGSHWLLRKSAAEAFARGLVRLDRIPQSMIEYEVRHVTLRPHDEILINGYFPVLGDHSRCKVPKIDPRFLGTQARLSQSIQLLQIAQDIKQDEIQTVRDLQSRQSRETQALSRPQSRQRSCLNNVLCKITLTVWLLVPSPVRIKIYNWLRLIGKATFKLSDGSSTVQRLPFGLYLKSQRDVRAIRDEFAALQLVRQLTSIPVPQPLDMISTKTTASQTNDHHDRDDAEPVSYILESRLPGMPLSNCQFVLSDRECGRIEEQLAEYLVELRSIPNNANADRPICSVLGEQCSDTRIRGGVPVGPFADEAEFNQNLRFPDHPNRQGHQIVFTHADLNPRNILVGHGLQADGSVGWGITGIVDWEMAGYYPEYWDYTKALFEGFRWTTRYKNVIKSAFRRLGCYDGELEIEVQSWESGDGC
ncbi:kinase-like domain-containing protein [Coniella lustricola]|uniref:Kinase-like domain-containing protein n=1 Tax=Coniella lustricola TaxID=2025994 RepID=A0A2T3ALH7_9PEZI|nr:kinase-like domain-containing protein [Coniella lustricola]